MSAARAGGRHFLRKPAKVTDQLKDVVEQEIWANAHEMHERL